MPQNITHFWDKTQSVRCPFYVGSDTEISEQNKKIIAQSLWISEEDFVIGNQRHGNSLKVITQANKWEQHEADALITQEIDIALGVVTADCLPILIHDANNSIISTIHAGWKGLRDSIIENTLTEIQKVSWVQAGELIVQIGPHISAENYEVGEEFRAYFPEDKDCFTKVEQKTTFSLWKKARKVLEDLWVKAENISISDICTYDNSEKYFSFRKNFRVENGITRASGNNCSYVMMS